MTENGGSWLRRLSVDVKVGVGLLTLAGLMASGFWSMDARYARASDLTAIKDSIRTLAQEVRISQLEDRLAGLAREKFTLENSRSKAALTPFEQDRLTVVTTEIGKVQRILDACQKDPAACRQTE